MTITLELTPDMEALIAGLKNRPVPQSFAELKPRRLPPPGKTAMQMVYQQIPAEASDEEVQAALKAVG